MTLVWRATFNDVCSLLTIDRRDDERRGSSAYVFLWRELSIVIPQQQSMEYLVVDVAELLNSILRQHMMRYA